jgi:hypothetical protein
MRGDFNKVIHKFMFTSSSVIELVKLKKEKISMHQVEQDSSFQELSNSELLTIKGGYRNVSRGALYETPAMTRHADTVISFVRGVIHG